MSFQRALGQAAREAHREANSRPELVDGQRPVFIIDSLDVDLAGALSLNPGDSADQVRIDLDAEPERRSRLKVSLRQLANEASDADTLTLSEFSERPGGELGVAHIFARDATGRPKAGARLHVYMSPSGGRISRLAQGSDTPSPLEDEPVLDLKTDADGVGRIEARMAPAEEGDWVFSLSSVRGSRPAHLTVSGSEQVTLWVVEAAKPSEPAGDANLDARPPPARSNRIQIWRSRLAMIETMRAAAAGDDASADRADAPTGEALVQRILALLLELIPNAADLTRQQLEAAVRARLDAENRGQDGPSES